MKNRFITILSILCLFLIFGSQTSIVFDHFRTTHDFLERETNAVLDDAYHAELDLRQKSREKGSKDIIIPPPTPKNTIVYNLDKMNIDKSDMLGLMNTAINEVVSKKKPLNIHKLDSLTSVILKARNIQSDFVVRVINPGTGMVLESSKKSFANSHFLIYSKYLPLDFEKKKSLQLVLINPFASIFKQMGTLLLSSFLLSLFCFYGLWFLFRIQARQKKLIDIKNDFFGHTAHELKRPVAHLHMALEALSNPAINENTAKRERYLAISKEATRDMSEKITMIMTLSMAEEGVFRLNYSEFDLNEVIAELKEKFLAIAEKSVAIQVENPTEKMIVKADKEHLSQSIANLIDNAIRYSKESVQIFISLQKIKTELILHVKDNGIGIKPERMDYVFEKYTRLNTETGSPPGFGIGLSYVKAVVEKHAGRIELKSEMAKGSEFILYLPV